MRIFLLFIDGVGLGSNDPRVNPFSVAKMPVLQSLLNGQPLTTTISPVFESERVTALSLDANLGVPGIPQSASGQATLLTGLNIPREIGGHYGPKPNPSIITYLAKDNLFKVLCSHGKRIGFLNAFPQRYFAALESGKHLPGAIAMAARLAGIPLKNTNDLVNGQAVSADLTGQAWRDMLGVPEIPVLKHVEAGERLAQLSEEYDFSIFEYWLTDIAGHRQDFGQAIMLLEGFDAMLGGMLRKWDDQQGLILITSDHGNLEDLSTRGHTHNPVPFLLIGSYALRHQYLYKTEANRDYAKILDLRIVPELIIKMLV
jgi:hypothetical protein